MSNLKQTVTDFLNDNRDIAQELMQDGCFQTDWDGADLPFEYRCVDGHGGEGQGDDFYTVIEVRSNPDSDETLLVKLYGWYASYDGANYEGWHFATPRQKTITVYD